MQLVNFSRKSIGKYIRNIENIVDVVNIFISDDMRNNYKAKY